jgi:hypothetical protein
LEDADGVRIFTHKIKMKVMITEKVRVGFLGSKEREQLKEEYFVNSINLSKNESALARSENNDCVVRAFMAALDLPYDKAHAWVKKELKRENNKGTYTYAYGKNILGKTKNGLKIGFIGAHPSHNMKHAVGSNKVLANPKYKKQTGYTLKSFMEDNPVGRFVLIVKGHAVAVVNGVLYGNSDEKWNGLYRSVWYGFECK